MPSYTPHATHYHNYSIAENAKIFRNTWRKVGLLAGLAQTLLTLLSIRPIRKRFYEFFFLGHVILVLYVYHNPRSERSTHSLPASSS